MITRMVIAVTVLFAVLLFMLPKTDDASTGKIASASMLMCTKDFRAAVAERVVSNESVDLAFNNKCPDSISELTVDESGTVTISSIKHRLSMVLSPVLENGKVRWSCRGDPANAVTALCKP